ncbi:MULTISPECIES: hypothetical protein [Bacillus]|uniref:hypothetical protein n=1 Tax=Bacillus TaxID=1386 RepID=UPI000BB6AB92|nr:MULTISPECIES: hypothetical protein [Bacillus]
MANSLHILEGKLEKALILFEQLGKYELALEQYNEVEKEVIKMMEHTEVESTKVHKLLAQCYLRQAGMLRQLGRKEEANEANQKEIESAKLSGNSISYAQSLFSTGVNLLSNREIEEGLQLLLEAKKHFEAENSVEHKQGLGWYWIIMSDLGNKGMIASSNEQILNYSSKAIELLTQIQNTSGIARAYKARATAYKNMGKYKLAENDLRMSEKINGEN